MDPPIEDGAGHPRRRKNRVILTPDDRERLVRCVLDHGMTSSAVAVSTGVAPGTVRNLVSRFNRGRGFASRRELFPHDPQLPTRGRRPILSQGDQEQFMAFVDARPWVTLMQCKVYIRETTGKDVGLETVRRILNRQSTN